MDRNDEESSLCIPSTDLRVETHRMDTWRARARSRMREIGLSQERLAEHFGMTPAAIQKWLAGTRQPTLEEINRIADHIGVTKTWLTYGLDATDTTDGLSDDARTIVRNLIMLDRSGHLPTSLLDAIGSMIQAVAPQIQDSHNVKSPGAPSKNGTTD